MEVFVPVQTCIWICSGSQCIVEELKAFWAEEVQFYKFASLGCSPRFLFGNSINWCCALWGTCWCIVWGAEERGRPRGAGVGPRRIPGSRGRGPAGPRSRRGDPRLSRLLPTQWRRQALVALKSPDHWLKVDNNKPSSARTNTLRQKIFQSWKSALKKKSTDPPHFPKTIRTRGKFSGDLWSCEGLEKTHCCLSRQGVMTMCRDRVIISFMRAFHVFQSRQWVTTNLVPRRAQVRLSIEATMMGREFQITYIAEIPAAERSPQPRLPLRLPSRRLWRGQMSYSDRGRGRRWRFGSARRGTGSARGRCRVPDENRRLLRGSSCPRLRAEKGACTGRTRTSSAGTGSAITTEAWTRRRRCRPAFLIPQSENESGPCLPTGASTTAEIHCLSKERFWRGIRRRVDSQWGRPAPGAAILRSTQLGDHCPLPLWTPSEGTDLSVEVERTIWHRPTLLLFNLQRVTPCFPISITPPTCTLGCPLTPCLSVWDTCCLIAVYHRTGHYLSQCPRHWPLSWVICRAQLQ